MRKIIRKAWGRLTSEVACVGYAVVIAITCATIGSFYSKWNADIPNTMNGFSILAGYFFLWAVMKSFTHQTDSYEPSQGLSLFELGFMSLLKVACGALLTVFALPATTFEGWLFWLGVALYMVWTGFTGLAEFLFTIYHTVEAKSRAWRRRQHERLIQKSLRLMLKDAEDDVKRQKAVEDSLLSDLAEYFEDGQNK